MNLWRGLLLKMEYFDKSENELISEEYTRLRKKHLRERLRYGLRDMANLLPYGLLPNVIQQKLAKKHENLDLAIGNTLSLAYEVGLGIDLAADPGFSYSLNSSYDVSGWGNFYANIFSINIPHEVFLVAGAFFLLDALRGFARLKGKTLGLLPLEAIHYGYKKITTALLANNEEFLEEAEHNIQGILKTRETLNKIVNNETDLAKLSSLNGKLYYYQKIGQPDFAEDLRVEISELEKKLGLNGKAK